MANILAHWTSQVLSSCFWVYYKHCLFVNFDLQELDLEEYVEAHEEVETDPVTQVKSLITFLSFTLSWSRSLTALMSSWWSFSLTVLLLITWLALLLGSISLIVDHHISFCSSKTQHSIQLFFLLSLTVELYYRDYLLTALQRILTSFHYYIVLSMFSFNFFTIFNFKFMDPLR